MTEPTTRTDLRDLYRRPASAPPARGDQIGAEVITGFTTERKPKPLTWRNDHVLLLGALPRPIPEPGSAPADLDRIGPSPAERLEPQRLTRPAPFPRECYENQLYALGAGGEVIRDLLAGITARGHRSWLVGGAVRDFVTDGPAAKVNDLDFTGTIGPGELNDLYRVLRRSDAANYEVWVSTPLVWSLTPPSPSRTRRSKRPPRLMEYKALSATGFPFPAWGGDFAEDATTRDLTVNTLVYDPDEDVLIDPTGRGRADTEERRLVVVYGGDDPFEQACVILRGLKFQIRWQEHPAPAFELAAWVRALPDDLIDRIPVETHQGLRDLRLKCVPEKERGAPELAFAAKLGPAAVRLVTALREGGS